MSGAASWRRAVAALRRGAVHYNEVFAVGWRAGLQHEARRQEDLLVTLLLLEALGVDNPASDVSVELYPEMAAAYHDWHRREGMERAPEPGVCC